MLARAVVFLVLALLPVAPVQATSRQEILPGQPSDYTSAIEVAAAMVRALRPMTATTPFALKGVGLGHASSRAA